MRRSFLVGSAVFLAAVMGVTATWFAAGDPAAANARSFGAPSVQVAAAEHWREVPQKRDQVMGQPDAPVTILEYSSLTCGHCGSFHLETLPKIKETYIDTGKVRLVFRDYPFDNLGLVASMLPHCVADDRYFGFLNVLFASQHTWATSKDPFAELSKLARLAGMSKDKIDACMKNEELLNDLRARIEDGHSRYEVDGTPTFFINGKKIVGNQPWEEFRKVIDEQLAASGKG